VAVVSSTFVTLPGWLVPKTKRQPAKPAEVAAVRAATAHPASPTAPTSHPTAAISAGLYAAWCVVCVAALIVLIGLRWLRYSSWSETPAINDFLREAMIIDAQTFLWAWVFSTLKARTVLLGVVIVAVCLHRRLREHLVTRVDGVWRLRRIPVSILLGAMVWLHYGFDINPTIGAVGAGSLLLLTVAELPRVSARLPRYLALIPFGLAIALGLLMAWDVVDRLTIGVWAAVLLASHLFASRIAPAHLALLRTAALIPMNILPATLPLVVPMHDGNRIADGHAYSFCEVPGRATIYASMPVCDSVQVGWESCRDSRIVEYDAVTLQPVASHAFLSPDFYGRLEYMLCLQDEVLVALQGTVQNGQSLRQSVMAFPVDDPKKFVPVIAAGYGIAMAYDEAHDAIFFTGEFNNAVVRYDRRARKFDDSLSRHFVNPWRHPFSVEGFSGSSMLYTDSIDPGRNRIYLMEFMHARYAHAIDLDTLQPVARYDVASGGAMGLTVDPDRNRLFVSSLWGLEVFDLDTGRTILRMRTGLGNRPVVVDRARNRLYLSSMVEGKIRILDRDTLELVDQIPIGIGSRFPYLTRDGNRLLASSTRAHFWWDLDSLTHPQ
jgi:hypothetical protein